MFLLMVLAPVYALLWMVAFITLVVGLAQKSRLVSWLGGFPLGVLTLGGLAGLALIFMPPNPSDVYQGAFGTPPPGNVTQLQAADSSWGDSGVVYLKFNAPPTTIQKITAKGWKGQAVTQDALSYFQDEETPTWWKPPIGKTTVMYEFNKPARDVTAENEVLIYDKSTGQAYYSFISID